MQTLFKNLFTKKCNSKAALMSFPPVVPTLSGFLKNPEGLRTGRNDKNINNVVLQMTVSVTRLICFKCRYGSIYKNIPCINRFLRNAAYLPFCKKALEQT
jgi:hypothetical protein